MKNKNFDHQIYNFIKNDDVESLINLFGNNISFDQEINLIGSNFNEILRDKPTPIMISAFFGSIESFKYFNSNGCDLSKKDLSLFF